MKLFLDTSALLAHYLGEPGAETVQALFEDASANLAVSVLVLYEFDFRLSQLGLSEAVRAMELRKYRNLLDEIAPVDERIRSEGARLRAAALERVSDIDILIPATASSRNAVLVHRDPNFSMIPAALLKQEFLHPR